MILQEQIGEIGAPFLIDLICRKILPDFVFEYFVRFTPLIIRLFRADNGT